MQKVNLPGPWSRRTVLTCMGRMGVAAVALGALPVSVARAAVQKISQKIAQYQDHPKGTQHCSVCVQFLPPDQCKLVAGKIIPNGWCIFFAPKPNAGAAPPSAS